MSLNGLTLDSRVVRVGDKHQADITKQARNMVGLYVAFLISFSKLTAQGWDLATNQNYAVPFMQFTK